MNLFFVLLYISFISFYEYFFSCAVNQILRRDHSVSCFEWTEKVVRLLHCVKRDVFFFIFFKLAFTIFFLLLLGCFIAYYVDIYGFDKKEIML